eukprot:1448241-Alexandrium_andersonii.AAC.1
MPRCRSRGHHKCYHKSLRSSVPRPALGAVRCGWFGAAALRALRLRAVATGTSLRLLARCVR